MSLIKSNFAVLQQQYARSSSLTDVNEVLASYSQPNLVKLLDHHSNRSFYADDVDRRRAFDHVLEYYSLMEVAAIASYIPADFPPAYASDALAKLEQPALIEYYEKNYKLLLPQLHRKRLRGLWRARERGSQLPVKFIAFTQLSKTLHDEDVTMFLDFLEDISIGDESLYDLERCVRDPIQFAAAFMPAPADDALDLDEVWRKLDDAEALRDPARLARELDRSQSSELTPTQQAVRGFRKFLFFCRDLHRLLESLAEWPLAQSAMWHHHAYWFGEITDLRKSMRKAVQQFLAWDVDDRREGARKIRDAEVSAMLAAIEAVTSGRYRKSLETAARQAEPSVGPRVTMPAFGDSGFSPPRGMTRAAAKSGAARKARGAKKASKKRATPRKTSAANRASIKAPARKQPSRRKRFSKRRSRRR